MKYVGIIPLIGGMDLAHGEVVGHRPEYLVSWTPFAGNDSHLVHHYDYEVPYVVVDNGDQRPPGKVDVVHSTCPCAGLSTLSTKAGADNPLNEWMVTCAEYVMGEIGPQVYWGENAPALSTTMGTPIREKIRAIGKRHGYVMSCYKTRSLLHGVPQIRERTFYFFWKGDRVPLLEYYARPHQKIEDLIEGVTSNFQTELVKEGAASDDPFYSFYLNGIRGGITHRDAMNEVTRSAQVFDLIEKSFSTPQEAYAKTGEWLREQGDERRAAFCDRTVAKINAGQGLMRRSLVLPKDYMSAFVGHLPGATLHPSQDRHLSYRECMAIMGLPGNFELLSPKKNLNHVCQNVPVGTASDMVTEVVAYLDGKRPTVRADYVLQLNGKRTHKTEMDAEASPLEEMFS